MYENSHHQQLQLLDGDDQRLGEHRGERRGGNVGQEGQDEQPQDQDPREAAPQGRHLREVSVSVNGKHIKTVTGRAATSNIVLTNLPCGTGATTVKITVTLSSGKTVTETHTYHLCTA